MLFLEPQAEFLVSSELFIDLLFFYIFVQQMKFDKTKLSCPWNSDPNCTQNYADVCFYIMSYNVIR